MTAGYGVLFDIDDTLVDLAAAMTTALRESVTSTFPCGAVAQLGLDGSGSVEWEVFADHFSRDLTGAYDRYMSGELTFEAQRVVRLEAAARAAGVRELPEDPFATWLPAMIAAQAGSVRPFADVVPFLDELDARRIPYGVVTNNKEGYQRTKLAQAGLERIAVVVGTDTIGVAKPEAAVFHEGARLIGVDPGQCWYVGDNPVVDHDGAAAAGLRAVWLDRGVPRAGVGTAGGPAGEMGSELVERTRITGLEELWDLLPADLSSLK